MLQTRLNNTKLPLSSEARVYSPASTAAAPAASFHSLTRPPVAPAIATDFAFAAIAPVSVIFPSSPAVFITASPAVIVPPPPAVVVPSPEVVTFPFAHNNYAPPAAASTARSLVAAAITVPVSVSISCIEVPIVMTVPILVSVAAPVVSPGTVAILTSVVSDVSSGTITVCLAPVFPFVAPVASFLSSVVRGGWRPRSPPPRRRLPRNGRVNTVPGHVSVFAAAVALRRVRVGTVS